MHGELEVWALARDVGSPDGNEDSEDGVEEPGDGENNDDNSDRSCACKESKMDGDDGYNARPSDGGNEPRCCAWDEAGIGALTGTNGGWGLIFDQDENGFECSDGTFIGCMGTFVDHEPG